MTPKIYGNDFNYQFHPNKGGWGWGKKGLQATSAGYKVIQYVDTPTMLSKNGDKKSHIV